MIIGCIYQRPNMNPTEFIDIYISELFQKISKEDKTIILMGDFNVDLVKYDTNTDNTAFLGSMHSNFPLPYISAPVRVTTLPLIVYFQTILKMV